ncbi:DJ-1/PfpI family protein [Leifsonia sp. A12D58]|uniref:DJ-1/PfpI family protein n=1 Tax=Leifsonia sp. A12D58 TaxID=3397674 RepID=UPI0039E07360
MLDAEITIVVALFPQLTQLDFTGPAQIFARMSNTRVVLAARTLDPVVTDCGWAIVPTATFDTAPPSDVLFVPGGAGAFDAMLDSDVLRFIRRQADAASFVTSVCTGSFVLGAAGLLKGKRATSHWASLHMLSELGAIPTSERVVRDGAVITGAGVSSGIDFALSLVENLRGREAAERIQLTIEYDPEPPFATGSPKNAPPDWITAGRRDAEATRLDPVRQAAAALSEK